LGFFVGAFDAETACAFCVEVAGHDGVDADLAFGQFEGQDFGDGVDGGFGSGVDGAAGCVAYR
jgi:hypothetical protein